jgi:hypothetical protein
MERTPLMAFMTPEYVKAKFIHCDKDGIWYPADQFSVAEVIEMCDGEEDWVHTAKGYFHRLSASGYTDATDWSGPFDSLDDARWDLHHAYSVDPDEGRDIEDWEDENETAYQFTPTDPRWKYPHERNVTPPRSRTSPKKPRESDRLTDFFFGKGRKSRRGLNSLPSWGGRRSLGFVEERGPTGNAYCLYVLSGRSKTKGRPVMGSCSDNLRHTQGYGVAILQGTAPVNVDPKAVKFEPVVPLFNIPDSRTLFSEYKIVIGRKPGTDTSTLVVEDTEYSILTERLEMEMLGR